MLNAKSVLKLLLIAVLILPVLTPAFAQDEVTLTISFPGDPRSETVNALIDEFVAPKRKKA